MTPELQVIARKIKMRMPSCADPNCNTCKTDMEYATGLATDAFELGKKAAAVSFASMLQAAGYYDDEAPLTLGTGQALKLDVLTLKWAAQHVADRQKVAKALGYTRAAIVAFDEAILVLRAAAERVQRGEKPEPMSSFMSDEEKQAMEESMLAKLRTPR